MMQVKQLGRCLLLILSLGGSVPAVGMRNNLEEHNNVVVQAFLEQCGNIFGFDREYPITNVLKIIDMVYGFVLFLDDKYRHIRLSALFPYIEQYFE